MASFLLPNHGPALLSLAQSVVPWAPIALGALGGATAGFGGRRLARTLHARSAVRGKETAQEQAGAADNALLGKLRSEGDPEDPETIQRYLAAKRRLRPPQPADPAALQEALADITANFDTYLSRLILSDEKHLAEQLRLYRDGYGRLKTGLEGTASGLADRIADEWRKIAVFAEAFGIELTSPEPFDDAEGWRRAFEVLEGHGADFLPEDRARIAVIRNRILPELLRERAEVLRNAASLGVIIETKFPEMESQATEAFRQHRGLMDAEERRLKARAALHGDGELAFAELARAQALNRIAEEFIARFDAVLSDIEDRLGAAAEAEHPRIEVERRALPAPALDAKEGDLARDRARRSAMAERAAGRGGGG